jgi:hypothetical protein
MSTLRLSNCYCSPLSIAEGFGYAVLSMVHFAFENRMMLFRSCRRWLEAGLSAKALIALPSVHTIEEWYCASYTSEVLAFRALQC